MRFYRLEKTNYFKVWTFQILKALGYSLLITILLMLAFGYKFMIVISGSMQPALPLGSLVIVTPCDYEDLQDGDIVTMDLNGYTVTHRIIGKYDASKKDGKSVLKKGDAGYDEATYWVTKGDANDTIDGPLTGNVIGVVAENHAFTFLGEIVRYVRANATLVVISLIILVVFVLILQYLRSRMIKDDIECYEFEEDDEE